MDTITHGIAGALLAKAGCRGEDMFSRGPVTRGRIITWALMLGAIFPDSDVLREFFSKNDMLIMTWHRSITHSLLCLPVFALVLAFVTRSFVRWLGWESPSFAALTGIYAAGILSHILLDLVTSFGTMVWSPMNWSRPAWDLIFIVDFTLGTMFLAPQIVAWVYRAPERLQKRALGSWLVFSAGALGVAAIGFKVGAPISVRAILIAVVLFGALFLLPALRNWGLHVRFSSWNFAGLLISIAYIAGAVYAHHAALRRMDRFVATLHIDAQTTAALPFPPSLWNWDGLVLTSRGVYEVRMDLSDEPNSTQAAGLASDLDSVLNYRFYPDAPSNPYIEAAKRLKEVQTVLWFARFPVIHFRQDSRQAIVEIHDVRFPQIRPDRPASFTYRVRFAEDGTVLAQGWVRPN